MGLDITAYSRLKHIGKHADHWCDNEDHVEAYAYDSFPQSFRGIPVVDTRIASGGTRFFFGGCYETTSETEEFGFRAGSYSGYGMWRADLQRQFNPSRNPNAPFYELIWFADNEGSIGPDAARDLLEDFRQHADAYTRVVGLQGDRWGAKYEDWTRACELAADGGLIYFH